MSPAQRKRTDIMTDDRQTENAASEGTSKSPCSVFPNPLCVRFGEGRILMLTFQDQDGYGVVLRDSGKPHGVGEDANMPPETGVAPALGEIYLHFANIKSAKALRLTLDECISEMSNAGGQRTAVAGTLGRPCSQEVDRG